MKRMALIPVLFFLVTTNSAAEFLPDSSALWRQSVTDSGLVSLFASPAKNALIGAQDVPRYGPKAGTSLRTLHKFYKKFISSQQGSVCCFDESCSAFGVRMMEQKGFIRGTLITFDRLTRCNGVNLKWYESSPQSRLNIDNYESCIP